MTAGVLIATICIKTKQIRPTGLNSKSGFNFICFRIILYSAVFIDLFIILKSRPKNMLDFFIKSNIIQYMTRIKY